LFHAFDFRMSLLPFLHRASSGEHLTAEEAYQAMSALLTGSASEAVIAAFLVALKMKGETAAELAGFARAMRERMMAVDAGADVIDTCGTGGDSSGTFNISTAAALVMAGAGARVAKHGNRSLSSSSGSADVLEALGVRIATTPEEAAWAVREIGIGFLFAPQLHPAMKFAQPVRRELKMRTVFNLLGPLVNPAGARRQLIGAPTPKSAQLMADALAMLETTHAYVVHGHGGLDEISTTGPTQVWEVANSGVTKHEWTPRSFGLNPDPAGSLTGGDPAHNASIIRAIFAGQPGPPRNIVLANSAAGLVLAGLAPDLPSGVALAAQAIDSGAVMQKLEQLRRKFPFS
jgi:anthranilate phosphoribosyltransferase